MLTLMSPAPVTGYMFGKGVYFADVSSAVFHQFNPASMSDSLTAPSSR